jgi:hypothetical protein
MHEAFQTHGSAVFPTTKFFSFHLRTQRTELCGGGELLGRYIVCKLVPFLCGGTCLPWGTNNHIIKRQA